VTLDDLMTDRDGAIILPLIDFREPQPVETDEFDFIVSKWPDE